MTLATLEDKLLFSVVGAANGLPVARCLAFVHRGRAEIGAAALRDRPAVEAFLRRGDLYPMFGKPTNLESGLGAASLMRHEPEGDIVVLLDGRRVPVARFADLVLRDFPDGYLFQRCIEQHPVLARLCGRTVSTVRVVTVTDGGAPIHCYASWKIARPEAMADNSWLPGSISAAIDLGTGRVTRAQSGLGLAGRLVVEHPGTGTPLVGFALPFWDDVMAVTRRGHEAFRDARIIGWDVALTPEGPLLVEGNTRPNHLAYQISSGRGALDSPFADLARRVAREHRFAGLARFGRSVQGRGRRMAKSASRTWRALGPSALFDRR